MPDYKKIQHHAQSVFSSLRSYFNCPCSAAHAASIQLVPQSEEKELGPADVHHRSAMLRFRIILSYTYSSPLPSRQPWKMCMAEVEELDDDGMQKSSADVYVPAASPSNGRKRVKISLPPGDLTVRPANGQLNMPLVANPCLIIDRLQQADQNVCLGYLLDEVKNRRHGIFPAPCSSEIQGSCSFTTRRQLLSPKGAATQHFSQEERLQAAISAATSVMRFHGTSWLGKHLTKNEIAFHSDHGLVDTRHSYIMTPSITSQQLPSILSSLQSACRNKMLFNLGILLTELCLSKLFESLFDQELQRLNLPNADPNADELDIWPLMENIMDNVSNEAGKRYENAVRRCLYRDFDRRSINFTDDGFYDVFYSKVVGQLKETYSFLFQIGERVT